MSALGQKQTSRLVRVMSVIPLKADIHQRVGCVNRAPKLGIAPLSLPRERALRRASCLNDSAQILERKSTYRINRAMCALGQQLTLQRFPVLVFFAALVQTRLPITIAAESACLDGVILPSVLLSPPPNRPPPWPRMVLMFGQSPRNGPYLNTKEAAVPSRHWAAFVPNIQCRRGHCPAAASR